MPGCLLTQISPSIARYAAFPPLPDPTHRREPLLTVDIVNIDTTRCIGVWQPDKGAEPWVIVAGLAGAANTRNCSDHARQSSFAGEHRVPPDTLAGWTQM
ncbi:4-hydroxy-tetrahydrodipicolinate synthase [Mycolicibacterium novocastrense]|uniref:4-hydroxy-tetrahydrodipicolinate synthase n=1 Tax=Mycolicibacterium novocastrense TaxID=59813 RepID=A0ABQ0KB95_MYCNV|nr:4-hydroxy-tetrahydrodipicolinate synthase [Mycolicibacterium novocastrense]